MPSVPRHTAHPVEGPLPLSSGAPRDFPVHGRLSTSPQTERDELRKRLLQMILRNESIRKANSR
jgi:hypothetical protein